MVHQKTGRFFSRNFPPKVVIKKTCTPRRLGCSGNRADHIRTGMSCENVTEKTGGIGLLRSPGGFCCETPDPEGVEQESPGREPTSAWRNSWRTSKMHCLEAGAFLSFV